LQDGPLSAAGKISDPFEDRTRESIETGDPSHDRSFHIHQFSEPAKLGAQPIVEHRSLDRYQSGRR
jgi:hypothetical protein